MIISLLFLTNQINPPLVSPMFSDNMVLQRDMKDPVFGWTTPGATVTVTINNKTSKATADQNGTWRTTIGPFHAGGPYTLNVKGDKGGFSATAYYFGRQLHQDLNVPIGLIHSSWGGTVAEAWTREDFLNNQMPEFRPLLTRLAGYRNRAPIDRAQELASWYAKNDAGTNQSW